MNDPKTSPRAPPPEAKGPAPRRISSEALLGNARELVIDHAGEQYRLCKTRQGKLILVK